MYRLFALVAVLALAATASPSLAVTYTATQLPILPGSTGGSALGINDNGVIVGTCGDSSGRQYACYWDGSGVHPIFQGEDCQAVAVDNSGIIVGTQRKNGIASACYWDSNGIHLLPKLRPYYSSEAWGVSNGRIVGSSGPGDGTYHACIWDNDGLHDLGYLPGYKTAHGWSINSSGTIAGWSDSNYGSVRPFVGGADGIEVLATLGENGWAYGINDLGQVVGVSTSGPGMAPYATLWDRDGIHNLGVVPGWRNSAAEAINNNGLVIGTSGWRACYWDSTGAHDLGAMIGTGYSHAKAVNNAGWIVGGGHVSSEVYRPYVWRPVPEPASILALLGGLGALALSRRR